MGDLQNNMSDISYPAVARTFERDLVAEPTSLIFIIGAGVLAGMEDTKVTNIVSYLLTFEVQVWVCLFCFLVVLSVVTAVMEYTIKRMNGRPSSFSSSWSRYFWRFFENTFCEASSDTPAEIPLRIVVAVWWITIVVLMNAFASQMSACLMVKSEVDRIESLEDVAKRPHLVPYTLENSEMTWILKTSTRETYRQLWRMIRRHNSDISGLFKYPEKMLLEVVREKAVIIHAVLLSHGQVAEFCKNNQVGEYYIGKTLMRTWTFVMYMNRLLPQGQRKRMATFVTRFRESGIFDFRYNKLLSPLSTCRSDQGPPSLDFGDMVSIFYLWAFCCLLAFIAFVAEVTVHWFATRPAYGNVRTNQLKCVKSNRKM